MSSVDFLVDGQFGQDGIDSNKEENENMISVGVFRNLESRILPCNSLEQQVDEDKRWRSSYLNLPSTTVRTITIQGPSNLGGRVVLVHSDPSEISCLILEWAHR